MRNSLRQRGSELLIRFGLMEKVTADIVKAMRANGDKVKAVYLQEEVRHGLSWRLQLQADLLVLRNLQFYSEEKAIERKLRKALKEVGVPLVMYDQVPLSASNSSLHFQMLLLTPACAVHPSDLPFAPAAMPDVFTPFRKRIENLPHLGRAPHPIPPNFKPFPRPPDGADLYPGYGAQIEADHRGLDFVLQCLLRPLQDTFQLRAGSAGRNQRSAFPYAGGETAALQRVEWYFKQGGPPPVSRYKETRNGLLGHAYSTKLSPFLCLGMVSPRTIISALEEYEEKYGSQQNAYWVRFELLWRDYFLFAARCAPLSS